MGRFEDLTKQRFGRLTVVERAEDYVSPKGKHEPRWYCSCSCGNPNLIIVRSNSLKSKRRQSCGCLKYESHKKYNTYDLTGEYGIGYTSNTNEPFYFDLEDYDKIKYYSWSKDKNGYISAYIDKETPVKSMHRLIIETDKFIDHINHKKYDNRKYNLREVTNRQNTMNHLLKSNNTSGVTGVDFMKNINKWRARIKANDKEIHLGIFKNFEDAVKARKEAEDKYFGEYSYDNSMRLVNT